MSVNLPRSFLLEARLDETFCRLLKIGTDEWNATKALFASGNAWTVHQIPKKKGFRIIHAPSDPLKRVSQAILKQLLQGMPVHTCVHGAHPGTSIVTNARVHAGFGQAYYLLDLKDAFPTVDRARLKANLAPKVLAHIESATDLTQADAMKLVEVVLDLLLVDEVMPQGFPTSPAVLNIVLGPLDKELSRLLRAQMDSTGIAYRYTRFLDDLTISTDADEIASGLRWQIRKMVVNNGWTLQRTKLHYFGEAEKGDEERSTKMPQITGIVPNPDGRLTIARPRLKRFRAILDSLMKTADARINEEETALASAREQMEADRRVMMRHGQTVDPTVTIEEFFSRDWPLTKSEHDLLVGIVGFVGMVYDGALPSVIRKPYMEAKDRFKIGQKSLRGNRGYMIDEL